jgi:hypothetical protein
MIDKSHDVLTDQIVDFLCGIGIEVRDESLDEPTFLPGIKVWSDKLLLDREKLKYPGDLLHEAGHLAVIGETERLTGQVGQKANQEILAIAWSYAAAVHLKLDPALVIHSGGFHGWREVFLDTLERGTFVGVSMLKDLGLTADKEQAAQLGIPPFPQMIRWLL